jgi:hypothetical protein
MARATGWHWVRAMSIAAVVGTILMTGTTARASVLPSIAPPPVEFLFARAAVALSPDHTSDLDGDGRGDVIAAHFNEPTSVVTALRGAGGAQIWSISIDHLSGIHVARVGTPARPGVILLTRKREYVQQSDRYRITMGLTAYDGATAARLWSWQTVGFTTDDSDTPTRPVRWRDYPQYRGLLPRAGAAVHVLMGVFNSNLLLRPSSVQPVVVDGATGQPTTGGGPKALENLAGLQPVGDLDGDGRADYAFSDTDLVARSSATGQVLWRHTGTHGYFFHPIGDTTGDHRDEVLFSNSLAADPAAYLLDGATGTSVIERHGDFIGILPLGDANGDDLDDVYMFNETSSANSASAVVKGLAGNSGSTLWQHSYTVTSQTDSYPSIYVDSVGDIQPDGAQDIGVTLRRDSVSAEERLFINGRTGGVRPMTAVGYPVFATIDGHGEDWLHQVDATSKIRAIDPVSQAVIWTYTPQAAVRGYAELSVGQLTSDVHADVVRSVENANGFNVVVVDGATGGMRWSRKV